MFSNSGCVGFCVGLIVNTPYPFNYTKVKFLNGDRGRTVELFSKSKKSYLNTLISLDFYVLNLLLKHFHQIRLNAQIALSSGHACVGFVSDRILIPWRFAPD